MDSLKAKSQTVPWKGVMALFGGFLIQLTLGSFYRWVHPAMVIKKSWTNWGNIGSKGEGLIQSLTVCCHVSGIIMQCLCSFGNMMTYLTSYMRQHGSPSLTYGDFIVVQSVWGVTQGLVMPLSGYISR